MVACDTCKVLCLFNITQPLLCTILHAWVGDFLFLLLAESILSIGKQYLLGLVYRSIQVSNSSLNLFLSKSREVKKVFIYALHFLTRDLRIPRWSRDCSPDMGANGKGQKERINGTMLALGPCCLKSVDSVSELRLASKPDSLSTNTTAASHVKRAVRHTGCVTSTESGAWSRFINNLSLQRSSKFIIAAPLKQRIELHLLHNFYAFPSDSQR